MLNLIQFSIMSLLAVSVAVSGCKRSIQNQDTLEDSSQFPVVTYPFSNLGDTGTVGVAGSALTIAPVSIGSGGGPVTHCGIKAGTLSLPSGLIVNPTTCVISGTPSVAASLATYTVVASNSAGTSSGTPVIIQIVAAAPYLSYVGSTGTSGFQNFTMTISPKTLQSNGSSITSCVLSASSPSLPTGLYVTSGPLDGHSSTSYCVITGTPTVASVSTIYYVIATNALGNSIAAPVTLSVGGPPVLSYPAGTIILPINRAMTPISPTLNLFGAFPNSCAFDPSHVPSSIPGVTISGSCVISGTPTTINGPTTYYVLAGSPAGPAVSVPVTFQFIDVPALSYVSASVNPGPLTTIIPTLTTNGSAVLNCVSTPDLALYGLSFVATTGASACQVQGTPNFNGAQTFSIVATNSAGPSLPASLTVTVNTPPTISYSSTVGTAGVAINIPAVVNAYGNTVIGCAVTASSGNAIPNPIVAPASPPAGYFGLTINATSCSISGTPLINSSNAASLNAGVSFTVTVTTKNAANVTFTGTGALLLQVNSGLPTVSFGISTYTAVAGTPISPSITPTVSTNNGGATLSNCSIRPGTRNLPSSLVINSSDCSVSGTAALGSSPYTYTLVATNSSGNTSADIPFILQVNGVPTVAYASSPYTVTAGASITITPSTLNGNYNGSPAGTHNGVTDCTVSYAGGGSYAIPNSVDVPAYTAVAGYFGLSINNACVISGTPTNIPPGTFTVTAINTLGSSPGANLSITVLPGAPVLSYSGSYSGTVGSTISFVPSTFGPDDGNATMQTCAEASGLTNITGAGLTIGTNCVISGTASSSLVGTYFITATNSNGSPPNNTVTASISINLNPAVPSFTYPASSVGVPIALQAGNSTNLPIYSVLFMTGGAPLLSCVSTPTLPAGLSLSPVDCSITGTPTVAVPTATQYRVVANNSVGGSTPASVWLQISIQPPILTYAASATGTVGASLVIPPVVISPNGGTLVASGPTVGINCTDTSLTPLSTYGLSIDASSPSTCNVIGIPTRTALNQVFTIAAQNYNGAVSQAQASAATFSLTINAGVPYIGFYTYGTSPTPFVLQAGLQLSISSIFSNTQPYSNGGSPLTSCSVNPPLPAGLSISNDPTYNFCIVSGTPTTPTSQITYQVFATNAYGTFSYAPLILSVTGAAPTLTYTSPILGYVGNPSTFYPLSFGNGGDPSTTCTFSSALSGFSINPTTCVISGTPMTVGNPFPAATIRATNSYGTTTVPVSFQFNMQWASTSVAGSVPSARANHSAVWDTINNRMIIWGGVSYPNVYRADGAAYAPGTGTWSALAASGISARAGHTAVWTGSKMIVWGGYDASSYHNDGGVYTPPGSEGWTATTTTAALTARAFHTAVWDSLSSRMVVHGGYGISGTLGDGATYSQATNSWSTATFNGCGGNLRYAHTAVWNSNLNQMIVFGGSTDVDSLNTGFIYTSGNTVCASTSLLNPPSPRYAHSSVWDSVNNQMIVFGGYDYSNVLNDGFVLDATGSTWNPLPTLGAPTPRQQHTAVFYTVPVGPTVPVQRVGMLIWGGVDASSSFVTDGGNYNAGPGNGANTWSAINPVGLPAPVGRLGHTAIWDPVDAGGLGEMVIWGGYTTSTAVTNTGSIYTP